MSKTFSSGSMSTPEIYSNGPSKSDCGQLFARLIANDSESLVDFWTPSIEEALREPQLGDVSFEVTYHDDSETEARWRSVWNTTDEQSWESLAKALVAFLQHANRCWLHPKSHFGSPSLFEHHSGIVDRVIGDYVSVCFGHGSEQFEVEYALRGFKNPAEVSRGDSIEAVIGLWHQKRQRRGLDQILTSDEQKKLDEEWNNDRTTVWGDLEL